MAGAADKPLSSVVASRFTKRHLVAVWLLLAAQWQRRCYTSLTCARQSERRLNVCSEIRVARALGLPESYIVRAFAMNRRTVPGTLVLRGAALSALLCGALAPFAQGQGEPSGSSPPKIVLKQPAGVNLSPSEVQGVQIAGLQLEVKALQSLLSTVQSELAANQAALQSLQTSQQNLQKQFGNHYHTLTVSTGGGLNSGGWGIFDVTQHGGRTVTVGLKFTCAPGVDSRCGTVPTSSYAETTSKPLQAGPQSP
jgi:hypothetical protein